MDREQESSFIPEGGEKSSEGNELSYEDIHQATLRALEHFEAEEGRPGVTPEGFEALEKKKAMITRESQEVGGVLRALGDSKLTKRLLLFVGGLSVIAATGNFARVEAAQREVQAASQGQGSMTLEEQMRELRRRSEAEISARDAKQKALEELEQQLGTLGIEVAVYMEKAKRNVVPVTSDQLFQKKLENLREKIQTAKKLSTDLGLSPSHLLDYAEGAIGIVNNMMQLEQDKREVFGEMRNMKEIIERFEQKFRGGDILSRGEEALLAEARSKLKTLSDEFYGRLSR